MFVKQAKKGSIYSDLAHRTNKEIMKAGHYLLQHLILFMEELHFDVSAHWQWLGEFKNHVLVLASRMSWVWGVNFHFELVDHKLWICKEKRKKNVSTRHRHEGRDCAIRFGVEEVRRGKEVKREEQKERKKKVRDVGAGRESRRDFNRCFLRELDEDTAKHTTTSPHLKSNRKWQLWDQL